MTLPDNGTRTNGQTPLFSGTHTQPSIIISTGENKRDGNKIGQDSSMRGKDVTKPPTVVNTDITSPSIASKISKAISNFMNNTIRPRSKRKAPMPIRYR